MKEGTCEPAEATKIQTDGERAQGDRQTEPERQGRTNTGWGGSRGRHGRYIPCGDAKARLEGGSVGGRERGRRGGEERWVWRAERREEYWGFGNRRPGAEGAGARCWRINRTAGEGWASGFRKRHVRACWRRAYD